MILAKPLLFITLSFFVIVNLQAQVGEKYYGRASYYADKFHGHSTSSGEIYDRSEYTAAHRDLPFNTIVEVINTTNNRIAIVKINDRGPFAHDRMIDLSFAAAKDLELLGLGEAQVEIKVLSMDKSEYTIFNFYAGPKGEFNRSFTQYEPVPISNNKTVKITLDTSYLKQFPFVNSLQPKPVSESFVVVDSLRRQQAEGNKMGFRQYKYIRVIKDGDGHYRLDSSIVMPPTLQEVYSVAPQSKNFNIHESRPQIMKSQSRQQPTEIQVINTKIVMKSVTEAVQTDNRAGGFRQHQYVRIYTDNEGRIRMDTTQKAPVQLVKNKEKQVKNLEDKSQLYNVALTNLAKPTVVSNKSKIETKKSSENYKNGFRQHAYIKIYRDKDGKTKVDTTSFENPK